MPALPDGYRSYGNGDINFYIYSYTNTWEKAELTTSERHIERFSKLGIPFIIPKSRTRLAEKREEEGEEKNTGNCKALCVLRKQNKRMKESFYGTGTIRGINTTLINLNHIDLQFKEKTNVN